MSNSYKCDFCGRKIKKKIRIYGHTVCSKHMHQLLKYGKVLDHVQRTNNDLNDFRTTGSITTFNLYGQDNLKCGEFVIDTDDLKKVRYHKWRFSHQHVVTGLPAKGTQRELSHVILGIPKDKDYLVVDHVNGDPTDNRKCNLRICNQTDNVLNKKEMSTNTSGFIGVSFDKARGKWAPEIRKEYIRCHLGRFDTKQEAVYARYLAEGIVFGEFCNEEEHLKKFLFVRYLDENRKAEIAKNVKSKLQSKKLWQ